MSSFALPEALGVQIGAGINSTSILHKRHQGRAFLLESSSEPESSAPFGNGLAVQLFLACTANDDGKWVGILIKRQFSKLESTSYELFGTAFQTVMLHNRKYRPEEIVDSVTIAGLSKIIPDMGYVQKPLPEALFLFRLGAG